MEGRQVDGARVRQLREQAGLNRVEFAKKSGVSVTYIKCIEGIYSGPGEPTTQPSVVVVYKLANALGVPIDAFTSTTGPVDSESAA